MVLQLLEGGAIFRELDYFVYEIDGLSWKIVRIRDIQIHYIWNGFLVRLRFKWRCAGQEFKC